jgi:hypothetical protein
LTAFKKETKEEIYRSYTADMLMCIAKRAGATVEERYVDLVNPQKEQKSAAQIKAEFIQRFSTMAGGENDGNKRV